MELSIKSIRKEEKNASLPTAGQGDAGDLNVKANTIEVTGGAQFQTLTFGEGDAGSMVVQASKSIDLVGATNFLIFGLGTASSSLFASAEPGSMGECAGQRVLSQLDQVL